jgi:hypothetical protein
MPLQQIKHIHPLSLHLRARACTVGRLKDAGSSLSCRHPPSGHYQTVAALSAQSAPAAAPQKMSEKATFLAGKAAEKAAQWVGKVAVLVEKMAAAVAAAKRR